MECVYDLQIYPINEEANVLTMNIILAFMASWEPQSKFIVHAADNLICTGKPHLLSSRYPAQHTS